MIKHLINFTKTVYQNYFEIASCLGAISIILLAILMDNILGLEASFFSWDSHKKTF